MADKFTDIVEKIDREVLKVVSSRNSQEQNDEAILGVVQSHIHEFKIVLDGMPHSGMDKYCDEYVGFYHFAQFMEKFASASARGAFNDVSH